MVTELQFAAVAAYLLWCLVSSLWVCSVPTKMPRRPPELGKTTKSLLPGSRVAHHIPRGPEGSPMTELKSPTAVLHEGPRSLSDDETADIERRDLREIRQVDIDDVIEYVHHGLRKLPDFVTLYKKYLKQRWDVYELDFTQDRIDWTEKMTEDERESFMGIASGFHHGERQVEIELPVFMIGATEEEKLHIAAQIEDEARHTVFFDRFYREVVGIEGNDIMEVLDKTFPWVQETFVDRSGCSPTRPTNCAGIPMTNVLASDTGRRTSCGSRACSRCRS